jgi:protein SCO1
MHCIALHSDKSQEAERFMMNGKKILLLIGLFFFCLGTTRAEQQQSNHPPVGIVEKLGHQMPLDLEIYDEKGYLVPLRNVISKPTILTFVYYRCPGICSPLLTELTKMVERMEIELGKDYQIVTISFDHREKPELAAEKRENYISSIAKAVDPNGWRFFTADSSVIQQLTDSAGFYFQRNGNDYVHAGTLIFLSPTGKVTRYILGIQYIPFDVQLAVVEAAEGRVGPTTARLLNFCYSFNPESHSYTMNITRIAGVIIIVLAGLFTFIFLVKPKKKTPLPSSPEHRE